MKKVIVRANQDIYDVCVQEYGSIESLNRLINDNNLNFNGFISQGQELKIDIFQIENEKVKDFFELNEKYSQNVSIIKDIVPSIISSGTTSTLEPKESEILTIVRANQDIYDVCIQEYGSLEFLNKLINDNNLNFNGFIAQGQELKIDNTIFSDKDIQDFFNLNNKNPKNGYIFKNDIPPFNWDNTNITFDTILKTFDSIQL